ncbi:hypothetical protein TI39_contig435g00001 [Zymoseptoria brevis]|uniref:Uncharacterized protein n=1 Tax=Zymoseptoria brevis TaxID=1047168 RepID=A0A0F4GL13_9PEZI|nr:hypothetical protein TI39_contig435g00001 [Zymoseptoria brevis]
MAKRILTAAHSSLALQHQDSQCANWLPDHGASPNTNITPLSFAIQHNTISFIQRLLDMGADIHHCQAVHYAVYRTLPDYIDVLNFVLSKNPPINHILWQEDLDNYYMRRVFFLVTPLHDAARRGLLDVCQVLLAHGANPRIRDSCGETSLKSARRGRREEVVEYLAPLTAPAKSPAEQFTQNKESREHLVLPGYDEPVVRQNVTCGVRFHLNPDDPSGWSEEASMES